MSAITCQDVHRRFKDVRALDGVTLEIAEHQIFGLLGPNGSGKTTLLNQIQGLDHPTSGQVRVFGLDPIRQQDQLVPRCGSQLQESAIIPRLTVHEALTTFAAFYPQPRDVGSVIDELGLTTKADARVEKLSSGQRQRVFIALALLHNPELLFFDELTSAVDPQAKLAIWEILRGLRAEGRTIVLTTHSMAEAQELCDDIAIIDAGRIIAQGTTAELIERHASGSRLHLETAVPVPLEVLQDVDGVTSAISDPSGEGVLVSGRGQFAPKVMAELATRGIEVTNMRMDEAGLEDVFLKLTGRHMREGE